MNREICETCKWFELKKLYNKSFGYCLRYQRIIREDDGDKCGAFTELAKLEVVGNIHDSSKLAEWEEETE